MSPSNQRATGTLVEIPTCGLGSAARDGPVLGVAQRGKEADMSTSFDEAKAGAFAEQLLASFNGAAAMSLTAAGYAAGLFEALAGQEPATSEQIAARTGLQQRYVHEWAAGSATAGILEYDPAAKTFALPHEHAAFLTKAAGPNNLGHMTQYIPLMLANFDKIVEAFRSGGGVGYEHFPNFATLQGEESTPLFDAMLVDVMLPLASGIPERLASGIRVLELGCGVGHAANLIAQAFPNSTVTGLDFNEQGIVIARKEAAELGLSNVSFEPVDVASAGGTYDLVVAFDVIHDLAQPSLVLRQLHDVLADDGTLFIMDINASSDLEDNAAHPMGTGFYFFSLFHCMTVSLAQGGEGLGTAWGRQKATQMLQEAGFSSVEAKEIEGDFFHIFYVARK